jgi:hypothetical protein
MAEDWGQSDVILNAVSGHMELGFRPIGELIFKNILQPAYAREPNRSSQAGLGDTQCAPLLQAVAKGYP